MQALPLWEPAYQTPFRGARDFQTFPLLLDASPHSGLASMAAQRWRTWSPEAHSGHGKRSCWRGSLSLEPGLFSLVGVGQQRERSGICVARSRPGRSRMLSLRSYRRSSSLPPWYHGGMEENPYKAPVATGQDRGRPRFPAWKWYGAVACIAIATFVAFAAFAGFFALE